MSSQSLFSRRLGKFTIPRDIIEDTPALAQEILSTVIVVRAEMLWDRDALEYIGISHSFESLPCGARAPWYDYIMEQGRFGGWVKV